MFRLALLGYGMPPSTAGVLVELMDAFATGKWGYVTGDAAQLLGRPPVSFATFAADFAQAFA